MTATHDPQDGCGLCFVDSVRRIERTAQAGLPIGVLMQRAARAIAAEAVRRLRSLPPATPVLVVAGPGNNGADALLAGLLLVDQGFAVDAAGVSDGRTGESGTGDRGPGTEGARVRAAWLARHGPARPLADVAALLARQPLIIDGLFGIGLARALGGEFAALVARLNDSGLPVIAVDVPSGLDADRGSIVGGPAGAVVRADATVTMIADKPGLHTGAGRALAGRVIVAKLGVRATDDDADGELLSNAFARRHRLTRALDSHKGTHGSVLIMGGASTMRGAVLLAGAGAQACGAGKVFLTVPGEPLFDAGQPQWMTRPWGAPFDGIDAAAIGCGLGAGAEATQACEQAFASPLPLTVDADALNAVAACDDLRRRLCARTAPTVLTPHPLEAARLLAIDTRQVQAGRIEAARRLARAFGAVTLIKGAGSVIADPDGRWAIVDSGSPALATGGSGDVLSGMVAALLAQGLAAPLALRLAAWHHGRAGELAQRRLPRAVGLSASEVAGYVRASLNE